MKVQVAKIAIGQFEVGQQIDVVADKEVEQLIKDGKPVKVLTQTRAKELLEAGYVEEVEDKAKTTTKAAAKAAETTKTE